jgi:hypothetical protein
LNSLNVDLISTTDKESNFCTNALIEAPPDILIMATPMQHDNAIKYEHYVDGALAGAAGFVQISASLFVAQGWDVRTMMVTVQFPFICPYII